MILWLRKAIIMNEEVMWKRENPAKYGSIVKREEQYMMIPINEITNASM